MPALESRSAVLESFRWDELEPLGFAPAESVAAITCVELRVPCGSPSPIGEGSVGNGVVRIAPRFAFGLPFANGVARVTLSGHPAAVPGSEGEYHRWEDGDWFCINKSGSIVKCPSSSNQESGS